MGSSPPSTWRSLTSALSRLFSTTTHLALGRNEHGVNANHVAIGNEKVYGVDDPTEADPGLIGMDLCSARRPERGRTAVGEAVDGITGLLEQYGQAALPTGPTRSLTGPRFLIVDPVSGWIVETSGRTWAARPVKAAAAISNRITITTDWTRASGDVTAGADFDLWHPIPGADRARRQTPRCERRPACRRLGSVPDLPRSTTAHLRDHGYGPWGARGELEFARRAAVSDRAADGSGVTVCMHVTGYMTTTASMVAELDRDPDVPTRVWAAIGSPCASVYVPFVFPAPARVKAAVIPGILGDGAEARRRRSCAALSSRSLDRSRRSALILGTLEDELWSKADFLVSNGDDERVWEEFADEASARASTALVEALASATHPGSGYGPGPPSPHRLSPVTSTNEQPKLTLEDTSEEISRILMVMAHPDDVDFGCAGSVAAWTDRGIEVAYCIVTDGDAGGSDRSDGSPAMLQLCGTGADSRCWRSSG